MSNEFFARYSESLAYRVENLANCESEQITRIGAIQPFGFFIACDFDFEIIAISENLSGLLGSPVENILGKPLRTILTLLNGQDLAPENLKTLATQSASDATLMGSKLLPGFTATIHRASKHVCIDIEPKDGLAHEAYPIAYIQKLVSRLNESDVLAEISGAVADGVKALTGFDRVMIYRFLENNDGEVIAEAKAENLEPFLHLRYPAGDIPEQARKLYYESRYRTIYDSKADAIPVHTIRGIARQELDMSCSGLRASSPIHIKYLQNMGVRSSFSVPIKVHGRLWGLISCHHYTQPVHLSPDLRSACELTSEMFASRILHYVARRRLQVKNESLIVTQGLLRSVSDGKGPAESFKDNERLVLTSTASSGAYLHIMGQELILGECPDRSVIDKTLEHIRKNDMRGPWRTDALKETLGLSQTDPRGAGALAVPFSLGFEDCLIWFRPEQAREVKWGGRPTSPADQPKTVLEPRASFAAWVEQVRDRSLPWTEEDDECAQALVFNFVQGIFAKAAALARAYSELERVGKAKDEFISLVSHELRTPLGIIIGWIDIMKDQIDVSEEMSEAIKVVDRNAKLQIGLINDLLDASRIISGKLRIDPTPGLSITQLITEVVESLEPTARTKSIQLKWTKRPNTFVTGDADRLRQVIWNLLTNAIKFTPKHGQVSVDFEKRHSDYVISVSDSGMGIGTEHLEFVFDRFVQVGSEKSKHPGLGLGLSIVKALTELHGGTVRAMSAGPGQGATFTVTLPIYALGTATEDDASPAAEVVAAPTADFKGLRFLVAEDQHDSARALGLLIERFGGEAVVVSDGVQALAMATNQKFDVILSDIGMPGMDGYEFMRAWRLLELGRRTVAVPAIALTAYARPKDRAMALEAGFQNHIAKPVDRGELLAVIRSVLRL